LAEQVDIEQVLTLGAVNALIMNPDGPFRVENNFYWYDSPRPRLYFPWDLDLAFISGIDFDPHGDGLGSSFQQFFLRDRTLRAAFDAILRRLVDDTFHPRALAGLLGELASAVGPSLEADRFSGLHSGMASEVAAVQSYLERRMEAI